MCFKIIHGPACSDLVPSKEADSCLFFFFSVSRNIIYLKVKK